MTEWSAPHLTLAQAEHRLEPLGSNWTKTHGIWPCCANTLPKSDVIKRSLAAHSMHSIVKLFVSRLTSVFFLFFSPQKHFSNCCRGRSKEREGFLPKFRNDTIVRKYVIQSVCVCVCTCTLFPSEVFMESIMIMSNPGGEMTQVQSGPKRHLSTSAFKCLLVVFCKQSN